VIRSGMSEANQVNTLAHELLTAPTAGDTSVSGR